MVSILQISPQKTPAESLFVHYPTPTIETPPLSRLVLFCFAATSLTAFAGERPSAIASESVWSNLEEGKVEILHSETPPSKGDDRHVIAAILIDHPVKAVWDVIEDKESASEYIKDLKSATIIEDQGDYQLVEQKLKIGPLPTFTYVIKHEATPPHRVDFNRVSGDLKNVEGYWEFHPLDRGTKTLLIYSLEIAPGIPVPPFIIKNSMKKSLPEALRAVKARVENLEQ